MDNTISPALQQARKYEAEHENKVEGRQVAKRPAYHVTPTVGWMNDPNGFSVYNGEYHIFYQYHPYSTLWGPMHWGHAVSKDLIRWERRPAALAPDKEYDSFGCFSGSAVEWQGKHLLVYTGVEQRKREDGTHQVFQRQCLAIGDGTDYEKLPFNPVIGAELLPEGAKPEDFRDPKVWVEDGMLYMVVGSRPADGSGQILLYRSVNLKQWELVTVIDRCCSRYGKMWECPDFFPLGDKQVLIVSPQEMKKEGLKFHAGNGTVILTGSYDRKTHRFERETADAVDYGLDFYAPQTMEKDGRRIMIAWLQSWDNHLFPDTFGWSGILSVPRELTLRDGHVCQNPVRELKAYRKNGRVFDHLTLAGNTVLSGAEGRHTEMILDIENGEYSELELRVAAKLDIYTSIIYRPADNTVTFDRSNAGMTCDVIAVRTMQVADRNGAIRLHLLQDLYTLELFVNDGEQAMSCLILTPEEYDGVQIHVKGTVRGRMEKYDIF